ncbi:sugar transferase [bacterium]|nr:sugar transferase [bacterium]
MKRLFDITFSLLGLILFSGLILLAWIIASFETGSNGFFFQRRVGKNGKLFNIIKIKTMKSNMRIDTTVTTLGDMRITKSGRFFRKTKIDELPQLWNVLLGKMSFVGPRPDVPGFADQLTGKDKRVLDILPGITSIASLKYKNEEELLSKQSDPVFYNKNVIFPDKVKLNLEYIEKWSFWLDLKIIIWTVFGKNNE